MVKLVTFERKKIVQFFCVGSHMTPGKITKMLNFEKKNIKAANFSALYCTKRTCLVIPIWATIKSRNEGGREAP